MHFTIHSVDVERHCVEVTFHTGAGDFFNRIFRLGFDDGKPEEPDLDLTDGMALIQAVQEYGERNYAFDAGHTDAFFADRHPLSAMVFMEADRFKQWVHAQEAFKVELAATIGGLRQGVEAAQLETSRILAAAHEELKQERAEREMETQGLRGEIGQLREEVRRLQGWADILNSPIWKRLWWWLQGWPLSRYAEQPESRWWM